MPEFQTVHAYFRFMILGIIPARFASSRFPGKPLADIHGKPMIQWVYERASRALDAVYVATDDARIAEAVHRFGGKVVMTSTDHANGTTRCLEAMRLIVGPGEACSAVINVQGDEPLLEPEALKALASAFADPSVGFATLISPVRSIDQLDRPGEAYVVLDKDQNALYFSRNTIPHLRDIAPDERLRHHRFWVHLGMYAYRPDVLEAFAQLPESSLEQAEKLEQNRWLEHGGRIRCIPFESNSLPVDTPEDLDRVLARLSYR